MDCGEWTVRRQGERKDIDLAECRAMLKRIKDEEIFPVVPTDIQLTMAPEDMSKSSTFIKRPGLLYYEHVKEDTQWISMAILDEILIMEILAQHPHP